MSDIHVFVSVCREIRLRSSGFLLLTWLLISLPSSLALLHNIMLWLAVKMMGGRYKGPSSQPSSGEC